MGFRECRDGWSGRVILVSTETRLQKPTLGLSGLRRYMENCGLICSNLGSIH